MQRRSHGVSGAVHVQGFHKPANCGGVAGVLSLVLAEFASGIVKVPRFCYFDIRELYDNVSGLYTRKIICEVSAYAKRRYAFSGGMVLKPHSLLGTERVAENHLFGGGVYAQREVLASYPLQLLVVVSAVNPEPLEHIGVIFRKVQAEYVPAVCVVKKCAQRSAVCC